MPVDLRLFTLPGILVFLTVMTLLVAAHELGHFAFARLFRMHVEEFAIGFGKKPLFTWLRRGETEFNVRPWPLGGFVKIRGMAPEEDGSEVDIPDGFYSKGPVARFIVLLAGPVFSLIAGWLLLLGLFLAVGVGKPNPAPVIGFVNEAGPAFAAGFKQGDVVKEIDGKPINRFYDLVTYVRDRGNQPLTFVIDRKGERLEKKVTPVLDPQPTAVVDESFLPTGEKRIQGKLQVAPDAIMVHGLGPAVQESNDRFLMVFTAIPRIFQSFKSVRENVGGPIAMTNTFSVAQQQGIPTIILLAAMLSISLGVFNLLPITPLDGGQMMVALIEMARRGKRLSFQMQSVIATFGIAIIGMFAVFVFANDIFRILGR